MKVDCAYLSKKQGFNIFRYQEYIIRFKIRIFGKIYEGKRMG